LKERERLRAELMAFYPITNQSSKEPRKNKMTERDRLLGSKEEGDGYSWGVCLFGIFDFHRNDSHSIDGH